MYAAAQQVISLLVKLLDEELIFHFLLNCTFYINTLSLFCHMKMTTGDIVGKDTQRNIGI